MANEIPKHIIDAVSGLLEPYGVNFDSLVRSATFSPNKYMTARQASVYCGLSPKTIRDKALSGEIGSVRIGKSEKSRVLIVRADLDNWLEGFSSRANHKTA
jgi:excisionase family DNA binding protein